MQKSEGRLNGKVALVLGAAGRGNMGQVIARRLRDEGANVVVAGRNEQPLREFSADIGCSYVLCDITDKAQVEDMVAFTCRTYGKIDTAINATGWGLLVGFIETSIEQLDKMVDLQFKGPFYFMQACAKVMGQGASIIQISSVTASIMLENHAAYMGAKAGTDHVMRCVANEFGHKGIRANSIAPGLTKSPMTEAAFQSPALVEAFRKEYPLGRVGTSDDVAAACVWLASDECFMTGQVLHVSGGLTLRRTPSAAEIEDAYRRDGVLA